MAKDCEIHGKGMQNFTYTPHYREFLHLVHSISPQTYQQLGLKVVTEDPCSVQWAYFTVSIWCYINPLQFRWCINSGPQFPLGIQEKTYNFVASYCSDYKYPVSAPLGLSVNDTKLFATLQPVLDKTKGEAGEWYLVGNVSDEPIKIPDMAALNEFMQEADTYEKVTKVGTCLPSLAR